MTGRNTQKTVLCLSIMFVLSMLEQPTSAATLGRSFETPVCKEGADCPERCRCYGSKVECSNKNLVSIPASLPARTTQLLLDHNGITHLRRADLLGCSNLKYLDLSFNEINEIDEDSLSDLREMEVLLLQKNCDRYIINGTIKPAPLGLLNKLTNLTTLDMHGNIVMSNLSVDDFAKMTRNLTRLSYLGISVHGNLSDLVQAVSNFSQLEELYLYCSNYNRIRLPSLQPLSKTRIKKILLRCLVEHLEPSQFSNLAHLETLDLSYMYLENWRNLSESLGGLENTNITNLYLVETFKERTRLEESFFKPFKNTGLKSLRLDSNFITTIGDFTWFRKYIPNLENLSLENNRIENPSSLHHILQDNAKLKSANFANQGRATPLYLVDNVMSTRVCREEPLSGATFGKHSFCRPYEFRRPHTDITIPDSLEVLMMSGVGSLSLLAPQGTITVFASRNFRHFSYAQNNLEYLHKLVEPGMNSTVHKVVIDLSDNGCSYMNTSFGEGAGNITGSLILKKNRLGNQLKQGKKDIFGNFLELTNLDLSKNLISYLKEDVFRSQAKLRRLVLSQNSLQVVEFTFRHMKKLTTLDVSGNLLNQLSEDNCHDLDDLAADHALSVSLVDNPLVCSCDTLPFLRWVDTTKVEIQKKTITTCLYREKFVPLSQLRTVILPDLNVRCKGWVWLIGSIVGLTVVLASIVASVALYRHRFEVRFALLKLAIGRKKYDAASDSKRYEYDAFVSYDKADAEWVSQVLVPQLEADGENQFSLCVHQRDFTGGAPITENITSAILGSRKIIAILTCNFLESRWCDFELETAHVRSTEEGKDLIVPVLLEDLPAAKMSNTLRVLLKRHTYIEWPEQPEEIGNFWRSLRQALRSKPIRFLKCQCGKNLRL